MLLPRPRSRSRRPPGASTGAARFGGGCCGPRWGRASNESKRPRCAWARAGRAVAAAGTKTTTTFTPQTQPVASLGQDGREGRGAAGVQRATRRRRRRSGPHLPQSAAGEASLMLRPPNLTISHPGAPHTRRCVDGAVLNWQPTAALPTQQQAVAHHRQPESPRTKPDRASVVTAARG